MFPLLTQTESPQWDELKVFYFGSIEAQLVEQSSINTMVMDLTLKKHTYYLKCTSKYIEMNLWLLYCWYCDLWKHYLGCPLGAWDARDPGRRNGRSPARGRPSYGFGALRYDLWQIGTMPPSCWSGCSCCSPVSTCYWSSQPHRGWLSRWCIPVHRGDNLVMTAYIEQ